MFCGRFNTKKPKMEFSFKNKKILVTGGCSGLGKSIAIALTERGAEVIALSIDPVALQALKEQHPTIKTITQDLANWDETRAVLEKLEPLDGLVNNAGIIPKNVNFPALEYSYDDLNKFLHINLLSAINCMQVIGKKMVDSGKAGSIVNISSILAQSSFRGVLPYTVSKAGLDMATKQFALELGTSNIRVNAVNPTLFMSETVQNIDGTFGGAVSEAFTSLVPMGRLPKIHEVVGPVLYLLSDVSSMVTGTTHIVDGGTTSCLSP